jgi:hypothetical protein
MFNKHLFKILTIFTLIIGFGLAGFALISHYQKNGGFQATAGQTK